MWRKYFKLPFKNGFGIYLYDNNSHPIANFLLDVRDEENELLVNVINGVEKFQNKYEFTFDKENQRILMGFTPLFLLRGWGYLTGIGGCHLEPEKAVEVQDSLGEYICEQLNNGCKE